MITSTTMLVIARGLPGSGIESTALEWLSKQDGNGVLCGRDRFRKALFGSSRGLTKKQEKVVTKAQKTLVRSMLESGKSVFIDEPNLDTKRARAWATLAVEVGVPFSVVDHVVDIESCIEADKRQGALEPGSGVGEAAIRDMADRYSGWDMSTVMPRETFRPAAYRKDSSLPGAWIFDLDGTLAHNDGHRGWYGDDELRVGDDKAWPEVVRIAKALLLVPFTERDTLFFITGRTDRCRAQTEAWLTEHLGAIDTTSERLLMRAAGDKREDLVVKDELFERYIAGQFDVHGAFEDRGSVAKMWRDKGIRVFQVGDGTYH